MIHQIKKVVFNKTFVFTILILTLISGAFYWFAYRPSVIRHGCSWTAVTNPATPAQPAVSKEEAENSQLEYDKCMATETEKSNSGVRQRIFDDNGELIDPFGGLFNDWKCRDLLKKESPAIPAQPEKVWYRKVTGDEYDFCLHEKGLK